MKMRQGRKLEGIFIISYFDKSPTLGVGGLRIITCKYPGNNQSYYLGGGGDPSRGVHLHTRGEKIGVFLHVFGAKDAAKTFLSTFFKIIGKFVNKNAIKSDFRGVVGRYISKISKKSRCLGKQYIYKLPKILRYIYIAQMHILHIFPQMRREKTRKEETRCDKMRRYQQ